MSTEDPETELYESQEEDDNEEEIDYNTLYNDDEDENIDNDSINSDNDLDDGLDEILPENNYSKFNIVSNNQVYNECEKNKKKFHPFMTKFEKIKVISLRAQQIEDNSPILVKIPENINNSREIAELEFKNKKIPFIIRRYHSNTDYYEDWKLEEFINYP